MNAAKKRTGWTNEEYEQAGKVSVHLRLGKTAAQILAEASEKRGISRQALIEELLAGYEAKAEQPQYTAEDYQDEKETEK